MRANTSFKYSDQTVTVKLTLLSVWDPIGMTSWSCHPYTHTVYCILIVYCIIVYWFLFVPQILHGLPPECMSICLVSVNKPHNTCWNMPLLESNLVPYHDTRGLRPRFITNNPIGFTITSSEHQRFNAHKLISGLEKQRISLVFFPNDGIILVTVMVNEQ